MGTLLGGDPSIRAPGLAGGSRSGFRPTGVLEGATGLLVGLHKKVPSVARLYPKELVSTQAMREGFLLYGGIF